jgi:hypothetical protein
LEEISISELKENQGLLNEPPKSTFKKIIFISGIILVFITGFLIGALYFFKPEILVKYIISKQNLPFEIDKLDIGFSGSFELERLRYDIEISRGEKERLQVEYGKGDVSVLGFLFSNTFDFESSLTGVKIPMKAGNLSGGNWILKIKIGKITKNAQQWDGSVELNLQNVNLQYKVMETSYAALIRDAQIKGRLMNGLLTLDKTQINADIARITISGNCGINNPYNMNIQLGILPTEQFEKKYPGEYSMLKSVMQNQTEIVVNLTGPVAMMKPRVSNLNLPGF